MRDPAAVHKEKERQRGRRGGEEGQWVLNAAPGLHSRSGYAAEQFPLVYFSMGNEPPSPRCCIDKAERPPLRSSPPPPRTDETLFRDSIVLQRTTACLSAFTLACSFYKPTRLNPRATNARERSKKRKGDIPPLRVTVVKESGTI